MESTPSSDRKRILAMSWAAVVLQIVTMILMATDLISTGVAVRLLAIVVALGLFPAMAHIKAKG